MKNLLSQSLIKATAVSLMALFSCQNFLKEDPKNLITEKDIPQTVEGARTLAYSTYDNWVEGTGLYSRWMYMWDVGTDDMSSFHFLQSIVDTYVLHNVSSQEPFMYQGIWTPLWSGVAKCNKALEVIEQMSIPEEDQVELEAIIGEIRTMRALYFYHLVRMWGDVPYVDETLNKLSDITEIERSPVQEIYEGIIIPDLEAAIEVLPNSYSNEMLGRVSKASAQVILAEVYLTMAGWRKDATGTMVKGNSEYYKNAMDAAYAVINNEGGYDIITQGIGDSPAYAMPWENSFSTESLVEFGAMAGGTDGLYVVTESAVNSNNLFWGQGQLQQFNGAKRGWYVPTPDLFRAFEEGDQRKDFGMLTKTIMANGLEGFSNPVFRKWSDPRIYKGVDGALNHDGDINLILYRVADALLIYAEAANEVNGGPTADAYTQINRLRNRAGLENLQEGLSQEDFRLAVWQERRVELHGECKRKFDLVRQNRLKEMADNRDVYYTSADNPEWKLNVERDSILVTYEPVPYPRHEYIWPIPAEELTLNANWDQNSGY
ncbi:RagB/SusD family nutrient uptake outer membrane protein [Flammeovirga agarivorans]|uniref:RagB/SusD family nutrient uptake outer membrane protein n=1 Tax=Flammeovirga agarivorans TaxID=2726742 RepID=A0A7X8SNW1_9BACT|nr:RagB/SusD family nutrient uptake outer membrane protein [Flammeovirga agarivorans]NLR93627.1 RagB/SusD family nutrient uptake outer membrane protein [Flammeovirga agarivorans]